MDNKTKEFNHLKGSIEVPKTQTLSQYLSRAIKPIKEVYPKPEKVIAEIAKINNYKGTTTYIELAEYSGEGKARSLITKITGTVYRKNAGIIQEFEKATNTTLAKDMKVLVDVIASYSIKKGISLEIVGIDHTYTAGDMALMQKKIKNELQAKGIFQKNRLLPSPFDYHAIGIISPSKSAGLEDFNKKLEDIPPSVLKRQYKHCTFQNDNVGTMISSLINHFCAKNEVDAILIMRGGGGTSDLNYLNNSELAHAICESPIPIYIGVGHQTDKLLIDDLAHRSFSTPSLVASHIRETILLRATETHKLWSDIRQEAQTRIDVIAEQYKDAWTKFVTNALIKHTEQENIVSTYNVAIFNAALLSAQKLEADVEKTYNAIEYAKENIKSRHSDKEKFEAEQIAKLEEQKRKHRKQLVLVLIFAFAITLAILYLLGNK